ncbi:4-alpha-glucanotransferase [Rhizobium sp. YIM 134829]|uniref:4-alpha-glucanotransferase n=1 Tax=Rhizobium sp. YIM 134829 TaxID=3390453 RepID=UPI00397CCA21
MRNGIDLMRPGLNGTQTPISDETKRQILEALGIDPADTVTAAPPRPKAKPIPACFVPAFLGEEKVWGLSLQLYELRSARNWGIGDFEDLAVMADLAGALGADFIGLNPLHAPFLADPERCSPYEPSNRQFLNPLYIAVDRLPGHEMDEKTSRRLAALRAARQVDYAGVAAVKLAGLHSIYKAWPAGDAEAEGRFTDFIKERGEALRRHALFEALSERHGAAGVGTGWHGWPEEYQDPLSDKVATFAEQNGAALRFHMWLQWVAHEQLDHAVARAKAAGLRIGLYLDLAVGEALDGSATWSERQHYVATATVGSPPDPFAAGGQDWRLAALRPAAIASGRHSPFERMVRAAMRYAGAIRIDHAAALRRLFLVPLDLKPDGGAYVDYPQDKLFAILARCSGEYQCLVIGEDLGTLPAGLQDDLAKAKILAYRILSYERSAEGFKPAESYPELALACISTHDHQTLDGWWRGADIRMRDKHGLQPADLTREQQKERRAERRDLTDVLEETGLEAPGPISATSPDDEKLEALIVSAHRFIARTPSLLAAVRLADLTRERQPTNVPGTSGDYPNWKPKLSVTLEDLPDTPLLRTVAEAMREERPRRG